VVERQRDLCGRLQFPPVHLNGQTFLPGQANNLYIFPAVGMAIFVTPASRVSDEMFIEAARAVADPVPSNLLHRISCIRSSQTGDRDPSCGH
jgi:malic enzyme